MFRNAFWGNCIQNSNNFVQDNAFEVVLCKMVANVGDESEAVAPIIWLYQTVDAQKEEVFFPDLLITLRRHVSQCMGKCGISKHTFEIPHKISYPYIERFFYTIEYVISIVLHFWISKSLRTYVHFLNALSSMHVHEWSISAMTAHIRMACIKFVSTSYHSCGYFFIEPVWYFS